MALHLLFPHSLTFADTAAYRAEFPYDPPSDLSSSTTSSTDYGATSGPDGGPGVYKTGGLGSFGFDKMALEPQGRLFRVKGRWKILSTGGAGALCSMFFVDPGNRATSFEGNLFIATCTTAGQISISVKTTAAYANAGANVYFEDLPGVFTPGTPFDFWVDGQRSTITEISPGVYAPNADGWLKAYVDGVEIADFGTLPLWLNESTLGVNAAGYYWNGVSFRTNGAISDIEIWDDISTQIGSFAAGYKPTVTGKTSVLFAQSGSAETNTVDNSFKVVAPGGIVLEGPLTLDGEVVTAPVVRSTSATLNDAQIKALPTTPITVVPAQGVNTRIVFKSMDVEVDTGGGVYTNIDANGYLVVILNGDEVSNFAPNDSGEGLTLLSSLFASGGRVYAPLIPWTGISPGWGPLPTIWDADNHTNAALQLSINNGGSGNLTGGDAANGIKVTVYYDVVTA